MKNKVFVIKDEKAGFAEPFIQPNELVAIRNFSQTCLNKETNLAKFPEDYSLWLIGEFDHDTGVIERYKNLTKIADAKTYAKVDA